jgi:DNA (cytosine-5)-methyltransferase 1
VNIQDIANVVRGKRGKLGMTQLEFAHFLGLKENGERTVSGWERGEHKPSSSKLKLLSEIQTHTPFKQSLTKPAFTFIDLFAGIGGIRLPYQQAGGHCMFCKTSINAESKKYGYDKARQ